MDNVYHKEIRDKVYLPLQISKSITIVQHARVGTIMDIFKGVLLSVALITSTPQTIEYVAPPVEEEQILTVEEKIVKYAKDYGVDSSIMLAIADAESNFKSVPNYLYTDENGKYTAYGIFQITRTTWKDYCDEDNTLAQRSDEDKNIKCAMVIASQSGYHHWNESKSNWQ